MKKILSIVLIMVMLASLSVSATGLQEPVVQTDKAAWDATSKFHVNLTEDETNVYAAFSITGPATFSAVQLGLSVDSLKLLPYDMVTGNPLEDNGLTEGTIKDKSDFIPNDWTIAGTYRQGENNDYTVELVSPDIAKELTVESGTTQSLFSSVFQKQAGYIDLANAGLNWYNTLVTPDPNRATKIITTDNKVISNLETGTSYAPLETNYELTVALATDEAQPDILLNAVPETVSSTQTLNSTALTSPLILNFDDSMVIPSGWESASVTTNGTAAAWGVVASPQNPSCTAYSTPNCIKFNSADAANGNTARLQMTSGNGVNVLSDQTVILSFYMYHDNGFSSASDNVQIQYSTDGGSTWLNYGNSIPRYSSSSAWTQHTVKLTGISGSEVLIGLLGKSAYGENIYLDNISLSEVTADVVPSGSGTQADPYIIGSTGNMLWITNNNDTSYGYSGKYFKQTSDFSLSGDWLPIGNSNYDFAGTYDGDGHIISNLNITTNNKAASKGLFGLTDSKSDIKNLGVIVDIDNAFSNGSGGLVGINYGKITNCKTYGAIHSSYTNDSYTGGLVGYNGSGAISQCSSSCSINSITTTNYNDHYSGGLIGNNSGPVSNCFATGNVSSSGDYSRTGGLVGYNYNLITNSYAIGTVSGYSNVGGLVGYNTSSISNCFARGLVSGTGSSKGGLVGYNSNSVIRCYYVDPSGTNGIGSNGGSVKYSILQTDLVFYKTLTSYTTIANWNEQYPWDFTTIWHMNNDLPQLPELIPGPTPTPTPIPTPTPTPTPPGPTAEPVKTPITATYDDIITQWIIDEANNSIYAITTNNKLLFINAITLEKTNEITLPAVPSDIDMSNGKIYVSLPNSNKICQIDIASQVIEKVLVTTTDPYRIAIDGNKLFYTEYDQWCDTYVYNLSTNEQKLVCYSMYFPDLAVDTEKHVLFIGERDSYGEVRAYSTADYSLLGTSGDISGSVSRKIVYDNNKIYYNGYSIDSANLTNVDGTYGETVICAKGSYVVSENSIFDRDSFAKISSFPVKYSLSLMDSGNNLFSYDTATNSIIKRDITTILMPIPTPNYTYDTNKITLDKTLTDWVFDSTTKYIYALSAGTNKLLYINADTMRVEGEKIIGYNPSDIALSNGKLYISLSGATKIAITGTMPESAIETISVSTKPYDVAVDGNKIFYSGSNYLFVYDMSTKTNQQISGYYSRFEFAVDSARHILYIGELGSSGSDFYAMDTSSYAVISSQNYDGGYGLPYASGMVISDGSNVYFAGRRFSPTDLTNILGNYGANVIAANNKYAVTEKGIYDNASYSKFADMPYIMSLALVDNDNLYTFDSTNKVIQKYSAIAPQPVNMSITGLTTLNISKLRDVTATYTILGKDQYGNDLVNPPATWTATDSKGNPPANISISDKGTLTVQSSAIAGEYKVQAVSTADANIKSDICITLKPPVSVSGVSLNKKDTKIPVGNKETLSANILPANADQKAVTWTSDNEDVATVEDGVVTAISPGTAKITAKTVDGNFTDLCTVLVPKPITGVAFVQSEATIITGDKSSLGVNILPDEAYNHAVTFSTSDESVIKIEDGYVVGLKTGRAVITVTTVDGGFTDECNVTVVNPDMSKQSFDTSVSIPGGWEAAEVEMINETAAQWNIVDSNSAAPNSMPNCAMFNAGQAGVGNKARLNMANTNGIYIADSSKASISFYMYHDNSYFSCKDKVQLQYAVCNASDVNWQNIGEPILRYSSTSGWVKHTIDLTGMPNGILMLGLLGISDNGNNILIDDISINGSDIVTDHACVMADASSLDISYAEGDNKDWVTKDIELPSSGFNQTNISWVSDHPEIVSDAGEVISGTEDATVVLTATVTKGSESTTKQFTVAVIGKNDKYYVHSTTNALDLTYAAGDNKDNVSRDILLASSGENETAITWASSDQNCIAIADGIATVKRPAINDKNVSLIATITKGKESETKQFDVVVKAVAKIAGGDNHVIALSGDGTVWAWGDNSMGQLGLGYLSDSYQPNPSHISGLKNIVDVVAKHNLSAALDQSGQVWVWGDYDYGSYESPFMASGDRKIVAIAAGRYYIMAIEDNGSILYFGGDSFDEELSIDNAVSISCSDDHIAILKRDGTVWSWGENYRGQLGNGDAYGGSDVPVQAIGLKDVVEICAGNERTYAITKDGSLWAWGYNGGGRLGINGKSTISTPTLVSSVGTIAHIYTGDDTYSYAIDHAGFIWSWDEYNEPYKIKNIHGAVGMFYSYNSVFFKNDGTVWDSIYNQEKIDDFTLAELNSINVPATELHLSDNSLNVIEGESYQLTAEIMPENTTDTIVWSSDNEEVATVDNGIITAIKAGKATIKVQAGQLVAECTVDVMPYSKMPYTIDAKLTGGTYLNAKINMQPSDDGGASYDNKYIVIMLQKGNTPVLVDSIKVTDLYMDLERAYNFTGTNYKMSVCLVDSFEMDGANFNGFGRILAYPVEAQVTN